MTLHEMLYANHLRDNGHNQGDPFARALEWADKGEDAYRKTQLIQEATSAGAERNASVLLEIAKTDGGEPQVLVKRGPGRPRKHF